MLTIDDLRRMAIDLLGSDAEPPGDDDDLIALGLDSIRFMRIANHCRRAGLSIGFGDLAREPTLAAWSGLLTDPARVRDTVQAAPAAAPDEPFALALMQHAYWIGRGGGQTLGAVAAHLYTEFDGYGVDPARLGVAVAALAVRHGMLRARILDDGRQVVGAWTGGSALEVLDLREASSAKVATATAELRERLSHQLLDVEAGQMFDVRVTLLPGGRTRVHVDVDMLAADARSYRVLLSDLVHLYARPAEPLPPLGYRFDQYLAAREPAAEQDVRWWRERVADLPGAPALPARPVSARPELAQRDPNRVVRLHHWLAPEQRARLTEQARAHAVTPAVAVATVFAEVLGAWSGEPRFLLNVPMFDRRPLHPDVDLLVGDFTGSVLLDVDVSEPLPFAERARVVQAGMHRAAAHASYSGVEVLRELSREQGAQVLAPVVFTSALDLGELFGEQVEQCLGEPVWIVSQGPQVVLDSQVTELHGGLLVNWDVRADAFPDGVADAMFAAFTGLVERVTDGTAWALPAGPLLPAAQHAVRQAANATDGPLPASPLHAAFFAQAARTPGAVAVLSSAGPPLTYGELADAALRVAGALRERGVASGDAVAIRLSKGPEQVVAVLGVLAAGAYYVPIGVEQPPARVARILRRAHAATVIGLDGDALPYKEVAGWERPLAGPAPVSPDSLAYVLFTSGSTGEPKGVELSHRAAANTVADLVERFGLGPQDRTLALSALDFDLSVFDIFAPLSAGGAVVTVDETRRRDPDAWTAQVREHRVSVLNCVPSLLDMLLVAAERDPLGDSLRLVLLGGDWVGVDLPVRLARQAPGCRFVGLGGTTETAIHSTLCEVRDGVVPEGWTSVPYGTPLRNVRLRVVDAQGRDCPDWVAGELWIGGAGVAEGYRGDHARTADRFVEREGLRWYRTGDRARYQAGGIVEFLGRADHQVKIRGFRIELGEVEAALAEHPAVRHATALVSRTGATARLRAVVVAGQPAAISEAELLAHAARRLPAHMVPDHVAVVGGLPLTANGKVDRRALADLVEPDQDHGAEPSTPVEKVVARLWAQVLGIARVGPHDDYFLLGGDSVLATMIVGRLREALDTDAVSVHDVLRSLTVARLAAALAQGPDGARLAQVAEVFLEVEALTEEELETRLEGSVRD